MRRGEARPGVQESSRVHGGVLEDEVRALGLDPEEVLDFSASCNPYGPCREVLEAIRRAPVARYPDPRARRARQAIAAVLDVEPEHIVLGNGACELLWTLAWVLAQPGTRVLVVEPTFCEFRAAVERAGARVHEWRARPDHDFALDLEAIEACARDADARVVYLCSPNTPTGVARPAHELAELAERNPGIAFVFDQSFLSLSERAQDVRVSLPANVVCVRSMTKEHAIAGVRLGYAVGARALMARIERARPAWPTSAAAQAAAVAACGMSRFVDECRDRLLADRARLAQVLERAGLAPVPSATCFVLAGATDGARLRARLLERHAILVRDCASFGMPRWVRLAARPSQDLERLEAALAEEVPRC